jgi:tetratricopeptide (TPR) repeat protein
MTCVDENAAAALLEGRLAVADAERLRAHALDCESCRQLVAELAKAATSPRTAVRADGIRRRGDSVGRYVVLGYLGEGGMGVVYLGYDPDLDRRVALKFLHDRGDAGWLVSEAQAIAKLAHPNVVSVFDIGRTSDGVYIAMEYVAGVTLREWLTAEKRSGQDIVARFRDAGRGLAAAHAAEIVHRDFKPDNVLVAGERVCVLDFGLAAHAASSAPRGGTPRYMAPEQASAGDVGPAADQYSFCVALDEALRGERIPARMAAAIARGRAHDPAQRHASMQALLAALAPRRPRAWLAVPAFLAIAGVTAAAFAAGSEEETCTGATGKLARVWNPQAKLAARAAFVATGVPYASAAWQRAEDTLERYGRAWSLAHTDVCRATERREQSQHALDVRMGCLAQRLRELDATATLFAHADARVVEKSPHIAGALASLVDCEQLDAAGAPAVPPSSVLAATVDVLRGELARARVLGEAGRYADAATLASATVERARATAYEPVVAEALAKLGEAQVYAGAHDAAEATLRDAFIAAETASHGEVTAIAATHLTCLFGLMRGDHEQGLWWARIAHAVATRARVTPTTAALIASSHGQVAGRAAKFDEALAQLDSALETRLALLGPRHLLVATTRAAIAKVRSRQGKYTEAIASLREVLAIREAALPALHPSLADVHNDLGDALASAGQLTDALAELRTALAIRAQSLGAEHPEVGDSHLNLGGVLQALDRPDEALREYDRALAIYEPLHHSAIANVKVSIGVVLTSQARFDDAERSLREGIALFEAQQGAGGPEAGLARMSLANALAQRGDDKHAIAEYRRARETLVARLGAEHPEVAAVGTNLGGLLLRREQYADALAELEPALAIQEKALGPDHPHTANTRGAIGLAHLEQGKRAQAASELRHALAAVEAATPDDRSTLDELRAALARAEDTGALASPFRIGASRYRRAD